MSITTWGWGAPAGVVTTWGWGGGLGVLAPSPYCPRIVDSLELRPELISSDNEALVPRLGSQELRPQIQSEDEGLKPRTGASELRPTIVSSGGGKCRR